MTAEVLAQRWVVVAEEEVLPPDSGGRVDHRGFLRAALGQGVEVCLLVPSRTALDSAAYAAEFPGAQVVPLPRDTRLRHHAGRRPYVVATRPLPSGLATRLAAWTPTAVLSWSVRVADVGRGLAAALDLPHLVRCHNLDSQYFRDLAMQSAGARRVAYRVEALRMARFERDLDADPAVTAFADIASDEAARHATRTRATVLHVPGFAVDPALLAADDATDADADAADATDADDAATAADAAGVGERSGVLFLGSLDVETNQQALALLLRQVWPLVRHAVPAAALQVVGRRPSADLREEVAALADAGVTLHADVADVAPFIAAAAVAVNPVRTGAGLNVKLLQCMAGGCACVSTSPGASGLDWQDGRDLLVADGAGAFATAVGELLTDGARRRAVAQAGRTFVRGRLDPAASVRAIAAALTAGRTALP